MKKKTITGYEPAFAQDYDSVRQGIVGKTEALGLTIRQEFAKTAMLALLSNSDLGKATESDNEWDKIINGIVIASVEAADALITELNKQP